MRISRLVLPVNAVDAFLYGGYLFLFLQDGSISYARFNDLIYLASHSDRRRKLALQLAFLPNQFLRGRGYQFLLEFPEIKESIRKEQYKVLNDLEINLGEFEYRNYFTSIGPVEELSLDVSIYAGKMFLASDAGVHKIDLNPDNKYNFHPEKAIKLFDSESIALTAKAGMLAVSAKEEGLFSYNIFEEKKKDMIPPRPSVPERSERAEWSPSYSLINYSSKVDFSFLKNAVEKQNRDQINEFDLPYNYKKEIDRKVITQIGVGKIPKEEMMIKTKKEESQLSYVFNTQASAFLFLRDGSLQVRNILNDGDKAYFSSKVLHHEDDLREILPSAPLSATAVQSGCLVETYDKVYCIKDGGIKEIADEPCYGIRSYLSSNNYRNLASIVFEDRVEILAFPHLPETSSERKFAVKRADSDVAIAMPEIRFIPDSKGSITHLPLSTPEGADLPF